MFFVGTMFDLPHTLYIIFSLSASVLIIYTAQKLIHRQKTKDMFLKLWALLTLFLHLLPLWVDFLSGEAPIARDNMLFPIYFCNLAMYFLVVVAFWGDKKTKTFERLATISSYTGMLGALISLFYPDYYLGEDTMFTVGIMKSLLSHSTMMIGSIYLMSGKYFKVDFKENTITFTIGLLFFGFIGILVNSLFAWAGLTAPNAMFLQKSAIEEVPLFTGYFIGAILILLVASFSFLVNHFQKKPVVTTDRISLA